MTTNPTNPAKQRGGARANAGRKPGSSAYGEATQAIRVPASLIPALKNLLDSRKQNLAAVAGAGLPDSFLYPPRNPAALPLPLYAGKVSAGFPSPADDYVEKTLDLNDLLVQKPAATFFVRAEGLSMIGAGIHPNDILVVDRSLEPVAGKIVICALNGELTVKRLARSNGQWQLQAENPDYADLTVFDSLELVIWGVVTSVIHPL